MNGPAARKAGHPFPQRSEVLDFLLEVASVTSETLELDELLPTCSEIVRRVIPYDLFAILLYNEKRKDLRIRYAVGHREEVVRNLVLTPGEGVVGTAAQTRQPVLVPDTRAIRAISQRSDHGAQRTERADGGAASGW